jgi:hypothetical protein
MYYCIEVLGQYHNTVYSRFLTEQRGELDEPDSRLSVMYKDTCRTPGGVETGKKEAMETMPY